VRVVPLSISDMQEIYQVLTALESQAAALVAQRGLSDEELAPLDSAVERMNESLEADDLEGWSKADHDFHRALLELCGNRRMAQMADTVFDQVYRARQISLRLRPKPWKSNEEHKAVIEAIRKGDTRLAAKIHREHREKASEVLTGVLKKYQLLHL
jgi:DNA-binding GntR family transcriptional regulator